MPKLTTQLIEDPYYLGGVFVDLDDIWQRADFTDELLDTIPDLEASERSCFENEKSPGGEPWAPNKPATIARKGHDVVLHETGRLGESLSFETDDSIRDVESHFLVFGTSVPYASFLTEGTAHMEPRPHVGITDDDLNRVCDRLADGIVERLTR